MSNRELLLNRLNEIGKSLCKSDHALALLALGSCGLEQDRMDAYSDLDFFAIVENGYKNSYIDNLDWLASIVPVGYCFKNSADGYKLLFIDGIFCEFAVFETWELEKIPFSKGRLVWKTDNFDETLCYPKNVKEPAADLMGQEWIIGEILSNILIGLGRYQRGEKFSAFKFVQNYAVDRIMDLITVMEKEQNYQKDSFDNGRRFEKRYPQLSVKLSKFIQGYEKTPESAKAILEFLDDNFVINECMKKYIGELL